MFTWNLQSKGHNILIIYVFRLLVIEFNRWISTVSKQTAETGKNLLFIILIYTQGVDLTVIWQKSDEK